MENTIKTELKKLTSELVNAKIVLKQSVKDKEDVLSWINFYKKHSEVRKLKYEVRHHHIAASLERGTPYEQIERIKRANRPNFAYIEEIRGRNV